MISTFCNNSHMTLTCKNFIFWCIWVILLSARSLEAKIGVNWNKGANLVPSMVVDLLLQNNVSNVKLFKINDEVIKAFSGTEIGVSIVIPKHESITSVDVAKDFIKAKVAPFKDVNIKYIYLGSTPFIFAKNAKVPYSHIIDSFRMLKQALDELGYGGRVKAAMTFGFLSTITFNNTRPSDAAFQPDLQQAMFDYLAIINATNVPFMFDYLPIAYTLAYNLDPNFGFFDNKSTYIVNDINGFVYNNVFDFVYDYVAWSLKKVGYENIPITVTQIGWPTDGASGATAGAAERFYKGLIPHVLSNRGTPMRPGAPIDIYMHSLTDEKKSFAFIPFMRHWGIYRSNGEPKYKIDFTGQGRDIYPTNAKGISPMPARWCVFNNDISDKKKVEDQFNFACSNADCTSLSPGASCGMLTANENVTYAFNEFFQANFQNEKACVFQGLGRVVGDNPSRDGCVFIVEVVKGNIKPTLITPWG